MNKNTKKKRVNKIVSIFKELAKKSAKKYFSLERDILPLLKEKFQEDHDDLDIEDILETNFDLFVCHPTQPGAYSLAKKLIKSQDDIGKKKKND